MTVNVEQKCCQVLFELSAADVLGVVRKDGTVPHSRTGSSKTLVAIRRYVWDTMSCRLLIAEAAAAVSDKVHVIS